MIVSAVLVFFMSQAFAKIKIDKEIAFQQALCKVKLANQGEDSRLKDERIELLKKRVEQLEHIDDLSRQKASLQADLIHKLDERDKLKEKTIQILENINSHCRK